MGAEQLHARGAAPVPCPWCALALSLPSKATREAPPCLCPTLPSLHTCAPHTPARPAQARSRPQFAQDFYVLGRSAYTNFSQALQQDGRCAACCRMLRAACHMLRAVCFVLRAACCVLWRPGQRAAPLLLLGERAGTSARRCSRAAGAPRAACCMLRPSCPTRQNRGSQGCRYMLLSVLSGFCANLLGCGLVAEQAEGRPQRAEQRDHSQESFTMNLCNICGPSRLGGGPQCM